MDGTLLTGARRMVAVAMALGFLVGFGGCTPTPSTSTGSTVTSGSAYSDDQIGAAIAALPGVTSSKFGWIGSLTGSYYEARVTVPPGTDTVALVSRVGKLIYNAARPNVEISVHILCSSGCDRTDTALVWAGVKTSADYESVWGPRTGKLG